jgi:hypothetical protein
MRYGGRVVAPAASSVTTFGNVTCESVIGVLSRTRDLNKGQRRHPTAMPKVGIEAQDARGLQKVKFRFQFQRWA